MIEAQISTGKLLLQGLSNDGILMLLQLFLRNSQKEKMAALVSKYYHSIALKEFQSIFIAFFFGWTSSAYFILNSTRRVFSRALIDRR